MVRRVIESFPVIFSDEILTVKDFHLFSQSFQEILTKQLPAAAKVNFIFDEKNLKAKVLLDTFKDLQNGEKRCGILDRWLLVPFKVKGNKRVVAIISETDTIFLQKVSEDWLIDLAAAAERDFLLLKQARVDGHTGLLNVSNLHYLLDTYTDTSGLHLILLELRPVRSSFRNVMRYSQKCAALLSNYVQNDTVLHYLGQSVFAMVLQRNSGQQKQELESGLVAYLKNEGCHRVHVGSRVTQKNDIGNRSLDRGQQLLDEAWTALCHAKKRGPFSFCDYSLLAHPENHPLAKPDRNIVRRLNRLWAQSDAFSLVHFCCDNLDEPLKKNLVNFLDRGETIEAAGDILVVVDQVNGQELLPWVEEKIRLFCATNQETQLSAGISSYPFFDFKKSELVFNCRKALLHADLLGSSKCAVFDGVSLNISGDIYFSDGDLTKAVNEYRRGIKCDGKNINLHNSLGVSLVMMNKLLPAMASFERALQLENSNFMALYNYGLCAQTKGEKKDALSFLQKALENYSSEDGSHELENDLKLQIGILSCEMKQYESALEYLVPWYRHNREIQRAGRVHYYLGATYFGLKDSNKAMESLQRALRYNEFDDRAMHLLGRLYFVEKQGDTIALSLCQKSVELEPDVINYRFHLAQIQLRCGLVAEARENLRRCLRNSDLKADAQLFMARSYVQTDQMAKAKGWYKKFVGRKDVKKEYIKEAIKVLR